MVQEASQKKKGIGCLRIVLIILATPILLFIVGFAFLAVKALLDSDEKFLRTYQPTAEIADLAEKNTLTDKGKAILYRADPQFVETQSFAKYCQVKKGGVEPLACIAPNPERGPFAGRQIFLLKIDDPEFTDHKYAATAHEMLHALLDQELSKHQDDPHLAVVIDILNQKKDKRSDGVHDELHSKFGVEYSDLSPELEEYYKQYFADRSKVVELFKNGGFNSRVRRMDEISYQLKTLAPQITTYEQAGDVANYNRLVGQYNSLAAESQRIYSEINEFYQYFNPDYKSPEEKKQ
ncbi:MAG: hypothetical protein HYY87_00680 [Candidatus Levybacteria bacterium]|nr:hypothetical protein [Candidatus Levybacteria bacterium]